LSILVVGSVAVDNIETPAGSRSRILGGACTYFATAASLYAQVRMVGVVGQDFPQEHVRFLQGRNIDLRGLQVVEGETFSWSGRYGDDLGDAETLDTRLNVFADFQPTLPEDYRRTPYVFLANIDPDLQLHVLSQIESPRLTALDSMNFWMGSKREALTRAMSLVDVVLLNEAEVIQYAGEPNLIAATQAILDLGPKALVVKRGRYGALLVTHGESIGERFFLTPAYPLARVVDPTGAGDTFAAGFMGYLAQTGDLTVGGLRRAVVHGTLVASFTVQDFSIDALRNLALADVVTRYDDFHLLTHYDDGPCPGQERLQRSIMDNQP
jgi:sugar/nucleoside kinase (ribokinase family)